MSILDEHARPQLGRDAERGQRVEQRRDPERKRRRLRARIGAWAQVELDAVEEGRRIATKRRETILDTQFRAGDVNVGIGGRVAREGFPFGERREHRARQLSQLELLGGGSSRHSVGRHVGRRRAEADDAGSGAAAAAATAR